MSVESRNAQRKKLKDAKSQGSALPIRNLVDMVRRWVALSVSLCLGISTSFLPLAFAAETGVGKLGSIIGKAYLVRDGNKIPAKKGMDVFPTDSLVTEPKAVVKIQFADGGSFMAFENSDVKIEEYDVKRQGDNVTLKSAFDIAKGKVRFFVKPGENRKNDAKYKTKNAVMGIRGTSGFIDTTNPGTTQLVVTTGKVEVANPNFPGQSVLVPANQMTDVVGNSAPTPPKPAPAELLVSLDKKTEEGGGKSEGETKSEANAEEKKDEKKDEEKKDEKKSDEKKDDEKKDDEKKSEEKKSDEKKSDEKKSDEKKSDEKKSDEKKPDEKKPDEKKPDEKKPDEKKSDEKKPDEKKSETKQESRKDGDSSSKTEQKEAKSDPANKQGSSSAKSDSGSAKSENSAGQTSGKSSSSGAAAAPGQAGGKADAANSAGSSSAGKQDSAPPTIKRVTVFSQDGSSSVAVSDSSLSKLSTTIDTGGIPPVKGGAGGNAAPGGAAPAAPAAAAVAAETRNVIKQVEKATNTDKVQEQIKTSVVEAVKTATTTAVEAAKPVATPPPPPPPTERNVKVKVVLPQ